MKDGAKVIEESDLSFSLYIDSATGGGLCGRSRRFAVVV
jgi:hypothetical protein